MRGSDERPSEALYDLDSLSRPARYDDASVCRLMRRKQGEMSILIWTVTTVTPTPSYKTLSRPNGLQSQAVQVPVLPGAYPAQTAPARAERDAVLLWTLHISRPR